MSRASREVLGALEVLVRDVDAQDREHVQTCARTARILAVLEAEGLANVLEAIRDGADYASTVCIEGSGDNSGRTVGVALKIVAKQITAAIDTLKAAEKLAT